MIPYINFQGVVYELLKKKAGYSKKTSRALVSPLPGLLNSRFSPGFQVNNPTVNRDNAGFVSKGKK